MDASNIICSNCGENHFTTAELEEAQTQIKSFLSRSLTVIDITPVSCEEIPRRIQDPPCYYIHFRLKIPQPSDDSILDQRSLITKHLMDQFQSMENNSTAPDTFILCTDHPPEHLTNQPLIYYLRTSL